jgi:outer membrane protein OmpA-like peptidoglycan-associated protein
MNRFSLGILLTMLLPSAALAQSLNADDLVRSLAPPQKPLTRSLGGARPAAVTRQIVVEPGREDQVLKDTRDLPSVNIRVTFGYNSDVLTHEGAAALRPLGIALRDERLKGFRFLIGGHTDAVGSDEYNQRLSERRARSVLEHLVVTYGVSPERLSSLGFGKRLLADAQYPDSPVNRRVEIVNLGQ